MNEEEIDKTNDKQENRGNPDWKPGMESPNPSGRPKGSKNFDTIFEAAIRKIVEEKKINIDDPEREMVIKAVIEALKGNYAYFRDLMDRKYGKAFQSLGIEHKGKLTIEQILTEIENEPDSTNDSQQTVEDKQSL